jgi:hypothetical protein
VAIRGSQDCCQAAKDLRPRRFLCTDAPLLPLEQCDRRDRCECRYARYTDRRQGSRRTDDTGQFQRTIHGEPERREAEGRRRDDHEAEPAPATSIDDTYYDYAARREP